MIRRLFTRPRTVTPQRFSGNACRICGNTFAMALPTHYCDELTYLPMAAEWDSRASGGATPRSSQPRSRSAPVLGPATPGVDLTEVVGGTLSLDIYRD